VAGTEVAEVTGKCNGYNNLSYFIFGLQWQK